VKKPPLPNPSFPYEHPKLAFFSARWTWPTVQRAKKKGTNKKQKPIRNFLLGEHPSLELAVQLDMSPRTEPLDATVIKPYL